MYSLALNCKLLLAKNALQTNIKVQIQLVFGLVMHVLMLGWFTSNKATFGHAVVSFQSGLQQGQHV